MEMGILKRKVTPDTTISKTQTQLTESCEYQCMGYTVVKDWMISIAIPVDAITNLQRMNLIDKEHALFKTNCADIYDIEPLTNTDYKRTVNSTEKCPFTINTRIYDYTTEFSSIRRGSGIYFYLSREAAHTYKGVYEGVNKTWDSDTGALLSEQHFKNGIRHGLDISYDKNGEIIKKDEYENGHYKELGTFIEEPIIPLMESEYKCIGYIPVFGQSYIVKVGIPNKIITDLDRDNVVNDKFATFRTNCVDVLSITHRKSMENIQTIELRQSDVTTSSLSPRQWTVNTRVYHCNFDITLTYQRGLIFYKTKERAIRLIYNDEVHKWTICEWDYNGRLIREEYELILNHYDSYGNLRERITFYKHYDVVEYWNENREFMCKNLILHPKIGYWNWYNNT